MSFGKLTERIFQCSLKLIFEAKTCFTDNGRHLKSRNLTRSFLYDVEISKQEMA